jgi:mRNA interferase MazF
MPFEFGDVFLVRFPFTNQAALKQRPAVVVSNRSYNTVKPDVVVNGRHQPASPCD